MKIFKLSVSGIVGLIIICISFIPLYNRFLTHQRSDRFDFNIKTLLLEYFLVFVLMVLFASTRTLYKKGIYTKNVRFLTKSILIYVFFTFFSVLLSEDVTRSLSLFAFGSIGPLLLYLIIVYKTHASLKNLKYFINVFLISGFLYLVIGYLFAFRFGFTTDLLEARAGKNIYGSNAVIGTISFILPFIFINRDTLGNKLITYNLFLRLFGLLSVVWIIISLSRWGYVTAILTYMLVSYSINKSFSFKKIVLALAIFGFIAFLIPGVYELIIWRFTGSSSIDSLTVDNIMNVTSGEARLIRWENAFKNVIGKNVLFGIGIGNNYLVDPYGNSDAHNLFVNMLIEQGLLAFIAILLVFVAVYRLVIKISKSTDDQNLTILTLSLGIGILVFHFWSLTGGTYIQSGGIISAVKNYYFFISMGLIAFIAKFDDVSIIKI